MKNALFRDEIKDLKKRGLYRELRTIEGEQDSSVVMDGKRVLMFSSNNYLGLANHPGLKKASVDAALRYGTGSGASRLISGNMGIHRTLEKELALFKGTDRVLLFQLGLSCQRRNHFRPYRGGGFDLERRAQPCKYRRWM